MRTSASVTIPVMPFAADDDADQIVAERVGLAARATDLDDLAVGEHERHAEDVVDREAVFEAVRAAGVLGDVAADRAHALRAGIGRVVIAVGRDRARDVEVDHAGLHARDAVGADRRRGSCVIRDRPITTQPSLGSEPPESPVPAPRGTTGIAELTREPHARCDFFRRTGQHDDLRAHAIAEQPVALVRAQLRLGATIAFFAPTIAANARAAKRVDRVTERAVTDGAFALSCAVALTVAGRLVHRARVGDRRLVSGAASAAAASRSTAARAFAMCAAVRDAAASSSCARSASRIASCSAIVARRRSGSDSERKRYAISSSRRSVSMRLRRSPFAPRQDRGRGTPCRGAPSRSRRRRRRASARRAARACAGRRSRSVRAARRAASDSSASRISKTHSTSSLRSARTTLPRSPRGSSSPSASSRRSASRTGVRLAPSRRRELRLDHGRARRELARDDRRPQPVVDAVPKRQPAAERLQRLGLHALTVPQRRPASILGYRIPLTRSRRRALSYRDFGIRYPKSPHRREDPMIAAAPSAPPRTMTAAEAAVRVMESEGVDLAFGIPGASILPLYDALRRSIDPPHRRPPRRGRDPRRRRLRPRDRQGRRRDRHVRPGRDELRHRPLHRDGRLDPDHHDHRPGPGRRSSTARAFRPSTSARSSSRSSRSRSSAKRRRRSRGCSARRSASRATAGPVRSTSTCRRTCSSSSSRTIRRSTSRCPSSRRRRRRRRSGARSNGSRTPNGPC